MQAFNYFLSYLSFQLAQLIPGGRNYAKWRKEYYQLQSSELENKQLAHALENICKKQGVLTFSEYLDYDQFGDFGYHANHKYFGKQNHNSFWSHAIANYCVKNKIEMIIELGPGDGTLGAMLTHKAKNLGRIVNWIGVEINPTLYPFIQKNFHKQNVQQYLQNIINSVYELDDIKVKSIIICSFSLDSIPPDLLINTSNTISPPNCVIGINVNQGQLSEVFNTSLDLSKKDIKFQAGIFSVKKSSFDLNNWNLYPWQRAYLPLNAIATLAALLKKVPTGSHLLIIDEIIPVPDRNTHAHFGLPKNLGTYSRTYKNIKDFYKKSGNRLLYYPLFHYTLEKTLNSLGCENIVIDADKKIANLMAGEKIIKPSLTLCAGVIATKKNNPPSVITLGNPYPQFT